MFVMTNQIDRLGRMAPGRGSVGCFHIRKVTLVPRTYGYGFAAGRITANPYLYIREPSRTDVCPAIFMPRLDSPHKT